MIQNLQAIPAEPVSSDEPVLYPHERIDDLQCNGYRIIQDPQRFCFGIDAVCLSNFATVRKGEEVLDLGTGTGIIPILLCAKTQARHITGLEIQSGSADMARRSVAMNGLTNRIRIDEGDIKKAASLYQPAAFDVITVNPPYMNNGGGILNENEAKAIARHEIACNLTDVITASARLLKFGGRLYMVHRPHRLAEIFCMLREYRLEPKTLRFVQANKNRPPSLALIEAAFDGKPMLNVLPVLMLDDPVM